MTSTARALVTAAAAAALPTAASAQLIGATPYLRFADSPFSGPAAPPFSYFYLERFEGGALTVAGVSATAATVLPPGPNTDSVDEDDGAVDGLGTGGRSLFAATGTSGITFTFDAAALGTLPTHAGVVWTDGTGPQLFEAFGPGGTLLGSIAVTLGDGSFAGRTAEDRFFGVVSAGGITAIRLSSTGGGIARPEVDHLQFGASTLATVPEPGSAALLGAGLLVLAGAAR